MKQTNPNQSEDWRESFSHSGCGSALCWSLLYTITISFSFCDSRNFSRFFCFLLHNVYKVSVQDLLSNVFLTPLLADHRALDFKSENGVSCLCLSCFWWGRETEACSEARFHFYGPQARQVFVQSLWLIPLIVGHWRVKVFAVNSFSFLFCRVFKYRETPQVVNVYGIDNKGWFDFTTRVQHWQ